MRNKNILILLLVMISIIIPSCSIWDTADSDNSIEIPTAQNEDEEVDETEDYNDSELDLMEIPEGDGTIHPEEQEGADVELTTSDVSQFYGKWEGTSDQAVYLYGNVEIKIDSSGSWSGNISEESLRGTWSDKGGWLHLNNEMFSFDVAFTKGGKLVMIETGEDYKYYTVLNKK